MLFPTYLNVITISKECGEDEPAFKEVMKLWARGADRERSIKVYCVFSVDVMQEMRLKRMGTIVAIEYHIHEIHIYRCYPGPV